MAVQMTRYSVLLLIFWLISSCSPSLTPYTQRLQAEYGWSAHDVEQIQFYLSDEIRLIRQRSDGSARIEDGKISVERDRKIDEIKIDRGTPGIVLFSPKSGHYAVSFESDDGRYLMFGPNPKASRQYTLLASEWKGHTAIVRYGGSKYRVAGGASARLMVELDSSSSSLRTAREAEGRRIYD